MVFRAKVKRLRRCKGSRWRSSLATRTRKGGETEPELKGEGRRVKLPPFDPKHAKNTFKTKHRRTVGGGVLA